MTNPIQTFHLSGYYDKIHCPYCAKKLTPNLIDAWQGDTSFCRHVLYIQTLDSIEYLSKEASNQIEAKGFNIEILKEIIFTEKGSDLFLNNILEYPNTLEIEIDSGVPFGNFLYIGISPFLNERNRKEAYYG
jgi:hypothetical protein